jgi:hypothetical protein
MLSLTMACSSSSEPVAEVAPYLADFRAYQFPFRLDGDWGLVVTAAVAAGEVPLASNERVQVHATGERGDAEELLLAPAVCAAQDGTTYECDTVLLQMDTGHDIREIVPRAHELPARLQGAFFDLSGGVLWLLGVSVERGLKVAQGWPGVRRAERNIVRRSFDMPPLVPGEHLSALVLVEFGDPVPGDGLMQLRAGEPVTFEYSQPDGTPLLTSTPMCEEPPGSGWIGLPGENPPCH